MSFPEFALLLLPGLAIGLTVHEFAHAWSASLLGDDFARRQGRVSLNPFRHLSPLGTLAILLLPFGWAKPVQVNLYNFRHPKRDYMLTSLAGPVANLVLAGLFIALMQLTRHSYWFAAGPRVFVTLGHELLRLGVLINVILAMINLIPIPPLDGSKIWPLLMPNRSAAYKPKTNILFLVVLVVLFSSNSLSSIISPAIRGVLQITPPSDASLFEGNLIVGQAEFDDRQYAHAEKLFAQALRIDPKSPDALYLRACARSQLNNTKGALADIDNAIALEGDMPEYVSARSLILKGLGVTPHSGPGDPAPATSEPATSQPMPPGDM